MQDKTTINNAREFAMQLDSAKERFDEMLPAITAAMPDIVAECVELTKPLKDLIASIEASDEAIHLADFLLCRLK